MSTDEHGRPEPPPRGDEASTLIGFLEWQRATLAWKTAGLDHEGLRATVGPSSMTLGGILVHLSWVEAQWTTYRLHGRRPVAPWDTVNWAADPDADWHLAADLSPAQVRDRWTAAVELSRAHVAEAMAGGGLDVTTVVPDERGPLSLRWLLVHLVEEYARHNGHADLLREAVDGRTGE
ncbi:Protein of unknown function [Klenkia marina]|uniref:DinB superfamily protein n=1 Tax=Klenkia marina TaxID=1960309 RepID=A0A1G4Z5L8_9ACTN|nr:DinB family protein [Klenkia marina]SCX60932.1 Protein of unknown function [Klenkia marina]